jgi:hypothetical protein
MLDRGERPGLPWHAKAGSTRLRVTQRLAHEVRINVADKFDVAHPRGQHETQAAMLDLLVALHGGDQPTVIQVRQSRRQPKTFQERLLASCKRRIDAAKQFAQS